MNYEIVGQHYLRSNRLPCQVDYVFTEFYSPNRIYAHSANPRDQYSCSLLNKNVARQYWRWLIEHKGLTILADQQVQAASNYELVRAASTDQYIRERRNEAFSDLGVEMWEYITVFQPPDSSRYQGIPDSTSEEIFLQLEADECHFSGFRAAWHSVLAGQPTHWPFGSA